MKQFTILLVITFMPIILARASISFSDLFDEDYYQPNDLLSTTTPKPSSNNVDNAISLLSQSEIRKLIRECETSLVNIISKYVVVQ